MAKIALLSKEVSELIAAGEVIERPSSVIKELIENSIDSGATSITVEIKNGGITYMRITDNGCGISEEDVPVAFLRHATSKISTQEDLSSILTLGFRGEALASVAAVSRVEVLTKTQSAPFGTHYIIEGSEERLFEQSGCSQGTTIVIRDLFYNVPARLKFLKKDITEANAVSGIVHKIALSHPEISFKLIRDNKQELYTPGDGDLYSAVYAVFGKSFAVTLLPVDYQNGSISVKGFVVKPIFARANRSFQNFFINDRYVKSITCTVSLEEAYKNSIMTGKFPACVLNLSVPPGVVDVNVHPAKIEVRFSDEKMIFDSVYFAVKNALLVNDTPTELKLPEASRPLHTPPMLSPMPAVTVVEKSEPEQMTLKSGAAVYRTEPAPTVIPVFPQAQMISPQPIERKKEVIPDFSENFQYISKASFQKKAPAEELPMQTMPSIRIIGEAFRNYILAEMEDSLLMIDKHAGHERLIFEKIKALQGNLDSQLLLEPASVLLSFEEYDALLENSEVLTRLGFSIVEGTPPTAEVRGVPVYLDTSDPADILSEIARNFLEHKQNPQTDLLDDLYHSIACRSAIKANDRNNLAELKALAERIYGDENIRYCPHGRPVLITLTKKELEKQFKRLP